MATAASGTACLSMVPAPRPAEPETGDQLAAVQCIIHTGRMTVGHPARGARRLLQPLLFLFVMGTGRASIVDTESVGRLAVLTRLQDRGRLGVAPKQPRPGAEISARLRP